MKKKNHSRLTLKLGTVVLSACLGISGMAFAQESLTENISEDDTVMQSAEDQEVRMLGQDDPDAVRFEMTNKTGKDIVFVSAFEALPEEDTEEDYAELEDEEDFAAVKEVTIYLQEALVYKGYLEKDPDGIYDTETEAAVEAFRADNGLAAGGGVDDEMSELLFDDYYEGNFLKYKEVISDTETVVIICPVPEKETDAEYQISIGFLEYDREIDMYYEDEYVLHKLPSESGTAISVFYVQDEFVYIEYQDAITGEDVSTYDLEKEYYDREYALFLEAWNSQFDEDDGEYEIVLADG